MLRPYSQLKQEFYLAPKQSARADLSSIKTFVIALFIFTCTCFIICSVALYGFSAYFQPVMPRNMLNLFILSVVLSSIIGLVVFMQSSVFRKITFKFPMIKAFQPKNK